MKILEGKKIAEKMIKNLGKKIQAEKLRPGLAVMMAGENEASEIYVRNKKVAAQKAGIAFFDFRFPAAVSEGGIIKKIEYLNEDRKISGIIVQLPLPKGLATPKIISAIDPEKDADGFHPENIKLVHLGKNKIQPAFPGAILRLIKSTKIPLSGKRAVIIANSKEFGEMMAAVLKNQKIGAAYVLRKEIENNLGKIKKADIVISACGRPGLIDETMIKKGAIVIDGGVAKKGKKVLGDVDFESVAKKAGFISPVPGGVGPVTIACLLENVYLLEKAKKRASEKRGA